MRRRGLIVLAAGTVLSPMATRAQQKKVPTIGVLGAVSTEAPQVRRNLAAFRLGLAETGYVEGQNVRIEYRWAERHLERLPGLAAELVSLKVDVIVTEGGSSTTFAAKNATSTIPVVFHAGDDPVATGLVASLARPGGNLTGVSMMNTELAPKLLQMLLEQIPQARLIGLLKDPTDSTSLEPAARVLGVRLQVEQVFAVGEVDAAFAKLVQLKADGFVINSLGRIRIAELALSHGVPGIALFRDFADAGGLFSYGPSMTDAYRIKGVYTGRILNGERAADLPVQQPTKFELVVNLKTAAALGLTVLPSILARADEVIE